MNTRTPPGGPSTRDQPFGSTPQPRSPDVEAGDAADAVCAPPFGSIPHPPSEPAAEAAASIIAKMRAAMTVCPF